jgi:hypothetical protein
MNIFTTSVFMKDFLILDICALMLLASMLMTILEVSALISHFTVMDEVKWPV